MTTKMKTLKDKIERIDLNEFFDTEIERKKAMFLLRKIEEQDKQAVKDLRREWEAEDGCLDWNRIEDIFGVWEDED